VNAPHLVVLVRAGAVFEKGAPACLNSLDQLERQSNGFATPRALIDVHLATGSVVHISPNSGP